MPTSKKVVYISRQLRAVRVPWYKFRDKILPEKTQSIYAKYSAYFTREQLERVAILFRATLFSAVVCECVPGAGYKEQLSLIFDFRLFLHTASPEPIFVRKSIFHQCNYRKFEIILNERNRFEKTETLSENFFQVIRLDKYTFPVEHAEKYLDYIDEIARFSISEITDFMESQIYNFLPSEGPAFYDSLATAADNLAVNPRSDAESVEETESDKMDSASKRVAFLRPSKSLLGYKTG